METFQKRLKALSAKVEQEGIILDENQVAALEEAKEEKQAHGEIEPYYPGFLVAQDTYYVGNIKGVDTFISRPSLILTPKSDLLSYTTGRTPLSLPICSMTG